MAHLTRYRIEIGIVLLFSITYFLSRLLFLGQNPIFTDEAIYLRWAQIALQDPAWTFISLSDGKQPLFIWLIMPFLSIFSDPLIAGRFVSVLAGFFSMLGIGGLSFILFKNKWIALLSSFLYLLYPMAFVYDRIALYDSLVGTFYIYGLLLSVLLVKLRRVDVALLLGLVIGGGLLTKSNTQFLLYLLPFTLLLFDWKVKNKTYELLKLSGLVLLSLFLAFGIESFLRLSPYYYIISEKNSVFVVPIGEWIHNPFMYMPGNLKGLGGWFVDYFGIAASVLVVGSFVLRVKEWREKVLLYLYFLAPFAALVLFGRVIYPRYLFFMTLPLLILVAYAMYYGLLQISSRLRTIAFILLLSPMFLTTATLIYSPKNADIPQTDKEQYLTSWPSGQYVRESVAFFDKRAEEGPLFIATQGQLGLLPYAFELYLDKNPNTTIRGYWPIEEQMPKEIMDASKKMPTFVVFYQPCPSCSEIGVAPSSWPLTIVSQEENIDGSLYTIYKVE